MSRTLLCLVAIATFNVVAAAQKADEVKVETGRLIGVVANGVVSFKGIPFAAPPTGDNRWRPPRPAKPWSGVRPATEYGPDPMQLPFPSDAAPLGTPPSEDCLYLNVWTPAKRTSSKLPVMVWIYGGGFVNGGTSPSVYDGKHFAERGVVFVSFNYRLGRFGFFAHPALTKESRNGPLGNYTYMDQIAALEWIRRNIANFGGDPTNITLFGESAGGISVLTLLTSPKARGLFQKAIIESGGGRNGIGLRSLHESTPQSPSGEAIGIAFANSVGVEGEDEAALAALRKLPADKIVAGLNLASFMSATYAGPIIDGQIVLETPQEAFLAGRMMKIPIIAGANNRDIGFSFARNLDDLFAPFGADAQKARALYDPKNTQDLKAIGPIVGADSFMIEPARFVVKMMTGAGQSAYHFRFSYVAVSMRKQVPGALHATEIPFVFDTVAEKYGATLAPEDQTMARAVNAYWAAFAKSGDPNVTGQPTWPKYKVESDLLMNFTKDGPVPQPDPWKARLDLVEALAKKQ
jgi:para-nitrobenzyl esterase